MRIRVNDMLDLLAAGRKNHLETLLDFTSGRHWRQDAAQTGTLEASRYDSRRFYLRPDYQSSSTP